MKKVLIFLAAALTLSSCGIMQSSALYYWGGTQNETTVYEDLTYKDYKKQTPEAVCKLVCAYEDMVSHPGGVRKMPPPGICAEYGYLLLQPSTAEYFTSKATDYQKKAFDRNDFAAFFPERGKEMFQKELEYYPESRQFIEPLLKKLAR